jgi:acid phosphatase type 7
MLFSVKVAAALAALASTTLAGDSDDCNENTSPTQIRLAYGGHDGMAVSWNTKQQLNNPTVHFGEDSFNLYRDASSDVSITYPSSSTWNNHVTLTGLKSDTTYYYIPQCGTQVYSFTTALHRGKGSSFQFAMVGDMGTMGPDGLSTTVGQGASNPLKPGDKTTIDSLQAMKPNYEFVWHGLLLPSVVMFVFIS